MLVELTRPASPSWTRSLPSTWPTRPSCSRCQPGRAAGARRVAADAAPGAQRRHATPPPSGSAAPPRPASLSEVHNGRWPPTTSVPAGSKHVFPIVAAYAQRRQPGRLASSKCVDERAASGVMVNPLVRVSATSCRRAADAGAKLRPAVKGRRGARTENFTAKEVRRGQVAGNSRTKKGLGSGRSFGVGADAPDDELRRIAELHLVFRAARRG
jgi:hypothetical protein